ncbi:hypothetical protein Sme01_13000 [Sphaerisporangium melleum]|uniref:DivIVA domain-containing protein n=1 Tax=Sphaerisporangium melleum TaxID=321316 RepID=A0A917RHY0_9ACTN|nr:hypothetical protein [Sphaerisporangium melleum]GGL08434.1 hypothetical protein GCM10007964_58430 [Sphaerisporangium melleum]GII68824.1 hypothetical protein Sme01_13000 [Sphaerisporangium melleum]
MLVLLAVAAVAVLYCVVMVAQGRGGELTEFAPDVPPLELPEPRQLTAVDFMTLHLPVSLVGYHTQTVDETLRRAATAISERDTHIAVLEQRLAELLAGRVQARQEAHTRPSFAPARTTRLVAAPYPLAEPEPGPAPVSYGEPETLDGPAGPPLPDAFTPPPAGEPPQADASAETAEAAEHGVTGPEGAPRSR